MYIAIAIFLALHGFAHLVGFVGSWGLTTNITPQVALLDGRIAMGTAGIRIVGVFWLIGAAVFAIAAFGVLRHAAWWPTLTLYAAVGSLLLSILGLPEAKLGIPVNIVIIAGLLLGQLSGSAFGRA
jgi:hypothetical protein